MKKKSELKNLLVFNCHTFYNESLDKTQVNYEYSLYSAEGNVFPQCIKFQSVVTTDNYEQFLNYCLDIVLNYFGTTIENYKTITWH